MPSLGEPLAWSGDADGNEHFPAGQTWDWVWALLFPSCWTADELPVLRNLGANTENHSELMGQINKDKRTGTGLWVPSVGGPYGGH